MNPAANKWVPKVRNEWEKDMMKTPTVTDLPSENMMSVTTSLFDWAEDVEAGITHTPVPFIASAAYTPRDFSMLRSDDRNPWSGLNQHH